MDYTAILKKYFGYSSFRGIQKDIVESIGEGRDTLGLMPTGGGKSVTFQVPALAMEGVCIVITPLIALMKDQVEHLRKRGISAASIYSGMSYSEILQTLDNAVYGGVKFLYVSPERIKSSLFVTKLQQMKVCFFSVDEAHCISMWGYDFRPSYLNISQIRTLCPDVPVLALTATATPEVIEDIQNRLCFRERNVKRMSFKRDNLVYVVRKTESKEKELVHILNSIKGSAIVYTRSRTGTKDCARFLESKGISATFYHAGLDSVVKDERQLSWQKDEVRVMVATNAFGMGIDKPDVRLVIHLDCPDSIEAYFQEAGRGGRDGNRSYAVLLYSMKEHANIMRRLHMAFPDREYIAKVYDHLAYFFQLAMNDGMGARYEFDVQRFCKAFGHNYDMLENSLATLQRAGYLEYNIDYETNPRCMFIVPRDSLYHIDGLTDIDDKVVAALLRNYTGIFADYVFINVSHIATITSLDVNDVVHSLKNLSFRRIIHYIPRRKSPVVIYNHHRIPSGKLRFPSEILDDLYERMEKRVTGMLAYAESDDVCRSSLLLEYFGEKDTQPCGYCDVCQEMRRCQARPNITTPINIIKDAIEKSGGKLLISSVLSLPIPRQDMDEAIEELRNNQELMIDGIYLKLRNG